MSQQEILEKLIRDVEGLKNANRNTASQNPLFWILNTNSPAQITANQNNYDPGDYDFLFLTFDTNRTITGFSGGVSGRALWIYNESNVTLTISHASVSSLAANRVLCVGGVNVSIGLRRSTLLIYQNTTWRMMYFS